MTDAHLAERRANSWQQQLDMRALEQSAAAVAMIQSHMSECAANQRELRGLMLKVLWIGIVGLSSFAIWLITHLPGFAKLVNG